jgi:hypothetical protein
MKRGAAAVAATGAVLALVAPSARAHVTVSPPSVEEDATSPVTLVTPNERAGHETVRLVVEVPAELEIASADAPDGWSVTMTARTATWSGGAISGGDTVEFPLELHGLGPAGAVELVARQGYEDGAEVTWKAALTVLPASGADAPRSHLGRALVAAAAGILVVGGSLAALHRLRRRSLPDR